MHVYVTWVQSVDSYNMYRLLIGYRQLTLCDLKTKTIANYFDHIFAAWNLL